MRIERVTSAEWAEALPDTGTEVFHTPEALAVLEAHSSGELHRLVGYKGDRPVAMFPVFVRERRVGRAVLSPPPSMGVPRLGPLVMPASPKQRKREKLNQTFTETVLDELGADDSGTLLRVICPPEHTDPRPFDWAGFDVEPAFTYRLDTGGASTEDLLRETSRSLRRDVREARETDVTVTVERADSGAARAVHEATVARYEQQDREYSMNWPYVEAVTTALEEIDRCRVYVARADGEFLTGVTVLYSDQAAYFWQGGTRTTHQGVDINSLLHWRIVEDIVENPPRESVDTYDLMGANTERLCRYKSKFGGRLVQYYVVESSGAKMELAKRTYRLLSD